MSEYCFTEDGMEDYLYWQSHDKQTLKKINTLLKSISRTSFTGEGKPEPLKGENGNWNRRINGADRLVYSCEKDIITIYQCKGHYSDK